MTNLSSATTLVDQIRNGDKQALARLYDAYSGMVYGIVLKMVKEEEIAQEIVQDVFLKVWKNIGSYDESKARISTWIMNIARNRSIDEIRSKGFRNARENQSLDIYVDEGEPGGGGNEIRTDSIGIKSVLEKLRPEQTQLVELLYFGGYTHEEAAKELNIPLGTVKTRIRSSIIELRKLLKIEHT